MKRLRYRDKDRIGAGGGGEVFRATLGWFGRVVAVKTLSPEQSSDAQLAMRLQREAATLAALDHEHIVKFEGVTTDRKGRIELVMEYVDGMTVSELVQGGPLSVEAAVYVTRCVLDALAYGHAQKLVHRDVSPRNVLVSWDGAIKLTDYGLVKPIGAKPTTGMGLAGTLPYLAPEQAHDLELDGRADLFAVGALLYKMVTGRIPFDGKTAHEMLAGMLSGRPPSWDAVPASLIPVIGKLLAGERAARYQSAEDVCADLPGIANPAHAIDDLVVLLRIRGVRRQESPRRLLMAAMVVGGLALAGLGGLGMYTYVADGGETQLHPELSAESVSRAPLETDTQPTTPFAGESTAPRSDAESSEQSPAVDRVPGHVEPGDAARGMDQASRAAASVEQTDSATTRSARGPRSVARPEKARGEEGSSISSGARDRRPSAVPTPGNPSKGTSAVRGEASIRGDRMSTSEGRKATGVTYDGLARPMGAVRDLEPLDDDGDSGE